MNRLKELRKEKKLTQEELAGEIGVSKITILRWENGERQIKPDKAQKLADHFGVPVGYLLGYHAVRDNEDLSKVKTEIKDLRNILENMSKFDIDFIDFLKSHDLYLSDTEIKKATDFLYTLSNSNDLLLGALVKNRDLDKLEKMKDSDFKNLFAYSTTWQNNYNFLKKQKQNKDN